MLCILTSIAVLVFGKSADTASRTVATISGLLEAVEAVTSGDTLLLQDGTYQIESYGITVRADNIVIKGLSGDRTKVVIRGKGMDNSDVGFGFWVAGDTVTIADLTITDVYYHCIQTDVNTDALHVKNCILKDAREQLLKVPYNSEVDDPSENGVVEACAFLFTDGVAAQYYTGGVDCHFAKNWIIRNTTFSGIRSPDNTIAEHAIHFWNRSEGTIVENNLITNCDRGIGFGLGDSPHSGGVIRNNMIWHDHFTGTDDGDVGIALESCTGTKVLNNTVYFLNDYPNAIEYRFSATTGVMIANNLTNRTIRQRDGASATLEGNCTDAEKSWFADASSGSLHLTSGATAAIDHGVTLEEVPYDYDGNPRSNGTFDIGADEYTTNGVIGIRPVRGDTRSSSRCMPVITCKQHTVPPVTGMLQDLKGRKMPGGKITAGMIILQRR